MPTNFSFEPGALNDPLDRGKEQIVPGHDSRYWLEFHLGFYRYANLRAKGKDALDIGCGYGYGSNLLAEEALSVTGLDFHPPAVESAKKNYRRPNLRYLRHDANEPLPFEDNSFDLIVSSEVLEHIRNQTSLIEEIKRVGRSGGHAIIKTPCNLSDPDNANPHHEKVFSLGEYRELMTSVFPKAEIYLWGQRIRTKNRIVEFPMNPAVGAFGDPNPSDKAVLLYTETTPTVMEPGEREAKPGEDLLAVCPIE